MKRFIGAMVLVLAVSTGAALAGPLYVGASVGQTEFKAEESGFNFDGSATSYKIYGGYRFMKFFGVEVSYLDFGSPDDSSGGTDVSVSATGWDAFAVGVLPFGKHFEIFGKAGLVLWDSDTDVSGSGSNSDSGTDTVYGAGLSFIFLKHLGVRAEYERYKLQDTDNVNIVSLGADFRF